MSGYGTRRAIVDRICWLVSFVRDKMTGLDTHSSLVRPNDELTILQTPPNYSPIEPFSESWYHDYSPLHRGVHLQLIFQPYRKEKNARGQEEVE